MYKLFLGPGSPISAEYKKKKYEKWFKKENLN